MKQVTLAVCLVASLLMTVVRPAIAGEGSEVLPSFRTLTCPGNVLRACCDNYGPKPLPCITNRCIERRMDDFCAKPFPSVRCLQQACASNRYRFKPLPDQCRPLAADYFTCVGRGCGISASDTYYPAATGFPSQP